jgi:sulfur-oxidizing protein SoxY
MSHMARRLFLNGIVSIGALLAIPGRVWAAVWPKAAFEKNAAEEALEALFGTSSLTESAEISMKAPEIAENGAVVPITITTTLPEVQSISIVVENNPRPLAASFELAPGTLPEVSSRIKMGETSRVFAVVKTGNGVFSTSKEVKVTIGGCGG